MWEWWRLKTSCWEKYSDMRRKWIRTIWCFIICPLSQSYYDYRGRDSPDMCHVRASEKFTQNSPPPIVLQPFVGPWPLFQFLDLFTQSVGLIWRGISLLLGRYLHRTTQTQNKRTQTSMPWVGFDPPIPVYERALDRVATVIVQNYCLKIWR
jgi:hypothetical protein